MPLPSSASANALVVRLASAASAALRIAAFSRSSRPIRPRSWDSVTAASGCDLAQDVRGALLALRREGREHGRDRHGPDARVADALGGLAGTGLVEGDERPAVVLVPAADHEHPRRPPRRRDPPASPPRGGSERPLGSPMRMAATGSRSRRCTTAFVKWVVPTITASTGPASPPTRATRAASALRTPVSHLPWSAS